MKKKRIIRVVDDDIFLRKSLRFMLECNGYQVVTYASAKELLERDDFSVLGCLILDIQMPEMDGLKLQEELNKRRVSLPIIFLSAKADFSNAVRAIKNGAIDYLEKPLDEVKFFATLEKILQSQEISPNSIEDHLTRINVIHSLSEREKQICSLLVEGLSKKMIGERLSVSEKTVETHTTSAHRKLQIHRLEELKRLWVQRS